MSAPSERIVATILGCGSSGGVPRIGDHWGACDPANPKNRRRRCSVLIEGRRSGSDGVTRILIDTGCDLREQMLDAGVAHVDAVLYTHEHADHTHGIDDLRVLAINSRRRIDVYCSGRTQQRLLEAFGYCFVASSGSGYPPILNGHRFEGGERLVVEGDGGSMEVAAFVQEHGDIDSLGFRIGNFAYSCDVNGFPEQSLAAISGLDVWVVDALKATPHPSHLSLAETLEWIARMRPRQAVLTNMHTDLDYGVTEASTPAHVTPAYDGMRIDITAGKVLRD